MTLPGPVGKEIAGMFTFVKGSFQSGTFKVGNLNTPIGYGIFLNEINATISVTSSPDGTIEIKSIGGGVAVTVGPALGGQTTVRVNGNLTYDFPVEGQVERWDVTGSVSALDHTLGQGEVVVSLGLGPSAGPSGCPTLTGPFSAAFGAVLGDGDGTEGLSVGKLISLHG